MALLLECEACHYRTPQKKRGRGCHKCGRSLKDAAWWADTPDGTGFRHRVRCVYLDTAKRIEKKIRDARIEGEPWHRYPQEPDRGPLLGEIAEDYLSRAVLSKRGQSKGIPIRTMKDYKQRASAIGRAVSRLGESTPVSEITPQRIHTYQEQRLADGLSYSSINRETAYLHVALAWAARLGKIPANPMTGYLAKPENPARSRVLGPDEYTALVAALEGEYLQAFILRHALPLRLAETLALEWSMVDLDDKRGAVDIPGAITKSGRERHVPLYYTHVREMLRGVPSRFRQGRVFTRSMRLHQNTFKDACSVADVPDFTLRDLKHCAITEMRAAGMPLELVSNAADHSSAHITDRYTNLTREHIRRYGQRWRWDTDRGMILPVASGAESAFHP